jgi:hypothetical protein
VPHLFQDSEGSITSAEIDDIKYESRVDFHGTKAKKIKMAHSKKLSFSTPPILNVFSQKNSGIGP